MISTSLLSAVYTRYTYYRGRMTPWICLRCRVRNCGCAVPKIESRERMRGRSKPQYEHFGPSSSR